MKKVFASALVVLLASVSYAADEKPTKLTVELKDAKGKSIGTATIAKPSMITMGMKKGTNITLDVKGLKPGVHAIHVHEFPKCEGPDFKSAGAHLNQAKKKHGQHLGDLPNFTVKADGTSTATVRNKTLTIDDLVNNKAGGASLVIHANADDMKTDPAGNSGARVACGVIGATASK